jgi:1,4-alpha-glucan branching enzyme
VASMLYLDYSRRAGEWTPNRYGGREDLDAVGFLRQLNTGVYADHPDVQTTAEESTAWPGVSRPVDVGGLGFGFKWDMGWMHDTLAYLQEDPIHRRYHHGELTFRSVYAFSENFVLPLSHDEVVHGKGSLLAKMPGDGWQKFATLRLLYGYQYSLPGKKLLFMGAELGGWDEWDHDSGLDWGLLEHDRHAGMARWVTDLNRTYRSQRALYDLDTEPEGFAWLRRDDADTGVLSFLRRGRSGTPVVVVCNFTPVPRPNVLVGVPEGGFWQELVNSDASVYGGSGIGNLGGVEAQPVPWHGWPRTLNVTAPPLGCVMLGPGGQEEAPPEPDRRDVH